MTEQLSAQDAQFLYMQSGQTLTHVMGINIYDPSTAPGGKVRFRDIVEHVRSRVHTSPVFRRKLHRLPFDLDHPYWIEDPNFDLEAHITHVRLPEPGDWRQFCIQTARHFSRPMDMSRPLWDFYIVEGLDRIDGIAPGSFAGLMRIHHSAIDGASAARMFVALADIDAAGQPAIDLGKLPSPAEIAARALAASVTSPMRFANALMKLSPALLGAAQKNFAEGMATIPKTRFNAPISLHKMFDATEFAIADLSAIRKKVDGATLNDVILAICSGALRTYLSHHGELPAASLVAVAPINRRTSAREAETPGNNISAMTVELATHLDDPLDRLRAIQSYTCEAKAAKAGLSARLMTDLTKHIPGATMAGVARLLTNPRFAPKTANVFISNVPGPQFPLYMAGARITHQYAMAPLAHNMGLFIATPSYDGRVTFNITSERTILPDIAFFRDCIETAFRALADAEARPARSRKPASAPKSRRTARSRPVAGTEPGRRPTTKRG